MPAHIVEIELQMKEDYAASIRKSKSFASEAAKLGIEDCAAAKGERHKADPEPETAASKKTQRFPCGLLQKDRLVHLIARCLGRRTGQDECL